MNDKNQRINYISIITSTCLLLVILWHCSLPFEGNPYFTERADITWGVAAFVGDLFNVTLIAGFVFCSGYLCALSLSRHNRTIIERIKRRADRLLKPYYIYGCVMMVPVYTLLDINSFGRPEHAGLLEGYKAMLLGQFSDYLWFLWMLFWVDLFFILISPLLQTGRMKYAFVVTVAAAGHVAAYAGAVGIASALGSHG